MSAPEPRAPRLGPHAPFSAEEQDVVRALWDVVAASGHEERDALLDAMASHLGRVSRTAEALESYPPVFQERTLGRRRRSLDTLVDLLAHATDANYDMFQPTRAMLVRALVMGRLNLWRLFHYIADEALSLGGGRADGALAARVDRQLHLVVYEKLAEELLGSIAMDSAAARSIRRAAVADLVSLWDERPSRQVRDFFPLLEATWESRRKLRVSVGTLLGVSEIMRLLQAGCPEEFVAYFSRSRLSQDEGSAFQEFLIGVSTEQISSLEQLLEDTGRSAISSEEAEAALGLSPVRPEESHSGVTAYQFYRERYLQAAARRIRDLPGPKRTAEQYMMTYYLEGRAEERAED